MEVVWHQDIGIKKKGMPLAGGLECIQEALVVRPPQEDPLAIIASSHQMVEQSGGVDAGMARHGRSIPELVKLGKSD
jgi:hypothetical protein